MKPGKRVNDFCAALTLVAFSAIPVASDTYAKHFQPGANQLYVERDPTPYAGDCGPNPPPGYRYDLKDWRSGFNRDFYCYMLDEN